MSSYYQKINTLYKRDMTKPKKPIILGEYSESEFEVLKDLKWEATEKIDGTNMSCCFHPGLRMIEIRGKTENASIPTHLHKRMEELFQFDLLYKAFGVQTVRAMAAQKLTTQANEWLADNDQTDRDPEKDPITGDEFARRILLTEFTVSPGGRFTAWYEDDDMFWGHMVTVDGTLKKGPVDADIQG